VILIRHGQTEFNRVFSVTRDPGIRDPHLTDQGRRQEQAVARVLVPFNLGRLVTSPYARALETAGTHSGASERADHGGAIDCRTLLVHLRHRLTLGRASCLLARSIIRPSAGPMVAPGGGNGGDDLASISELPSTDRRRAMDWGFIRALTGLKVPNGAVLWIDPTRPVASLSFFLCRMPARAGTDR
jgi:hypothetical protein